MATAKTAKTLPQITGHGHTHDGRRCFTVASQTQANVWHIVIVNPQALTCNCKASQYHPQTPCAHRKVVRARLLAERDAQREFETRETTAPAHETALPGWYANSEPFSIFK